MKHANGLHHVCRYPICHGSFELAGVSIAGRCADGWFGTASVIGCTKKSGTYTLKGCTDSRVCKAPPTTRGYIVSENDLVISTFDVSAQCVTGFSKAPNVKEVKASPCTEDQGLYTLSGCIPDSAA